MSTPAHSADPAVHIPTGELDRLISMLSGPVGTLTEVLVRAIASSVQTMLDQSYRAGVSAGLAQAEHRVAQLVGTRADPRIHGTDGVLMRCHTCGGEGLVVRTDAPSPFPRTDPAATTVIPRLADPNRDTAVLPKVNDPTMTSKYDPLGRCD